jgi:hypothetical protein
VGKHEGKGSLGNRDLHGKIIIKWMFSKWDGKYRMD